MGGCTSDAALSDHDGFTAFEMEIFQQFPTSAPTDEPDTYDVIGTNKKCPHGSSKRLFTTTDDGPLTREECYDRCYNTKGCHYFSLGEHTNNKKWMGLCMGCTADAALSDHNGFTAFEMEIFQDFPTSAPTVNKDASLYEFTASNKKCPWRNRLFRTRDNEPLTRTEC